jgi:hypothetical protein
VLVLFLGFGFKPLALSLPLHLGCCHVHGHWLLEIVAWKEFFSSEFWDGPSCFMFLDVTINKVCATHQNLQIFSSSGKGAD